MNRILSVGSKFPEFNKKAVVSTEMGKEFTDLTLAKCVENDKWMVMFWWPMDFTFVCPTEISTFNKHFLEFNERKATLIGASTDSEYSHLAWRTSHPGLKELRFPMLADTSKSLAEELGILEASQKVAYRVTYIVDPKGIIRHVSVNDLSAGRNVEEVLRVLDALQIEKLTPCGWVKGDDTL